MAGFVDWQKPAFTGRGASVAARDEGVAEKFATFVIAAEDAAEAGADCFGGESILRDGAYAGYVTSGGFGHAVGESLALGYIATEHWQDGARFRD